MLSYLVFHVVITAIPMSDMDNEPKQKKEAKTNRAPMATAPFPSASMHEY